MMRYASEPELDVSLYVTGADLFLALSEGGARKSARTHHFKSYEKTARLVRAGGFVEAYLAMIRLRPVPWRRCVWPFEVSRRLALQSGGCVRG